MTRFGATPSLLASLALAGLLLLRVRHERYAGPIEHVYPNEASFSADETPEPLLTDHFSFRALPAMLPPALEINLRGTKSREWIGLFFRPPEGLREHVIKGASAELRHDFLDLPLIGPVAGKTVLSIGPAEWRDAPWRLWGWGVGISAFPIVLWLLAFIPTALRERIVKRPAS